MGVSESLVRKFIAFLSVYQGCQGIYTFPTVDGVSEFVQTRINPIIEGCSLLQQNYKLNVDRVSIKQIGESFAHFKGSFGEKQTISVPSDFNVHDEINFSKPDIQNLFRSRLEHSSFAWEINCSTPTLPVYAISDMFDQSDQHYWYIKCPHCNHWQSMEYFP